jgi:hypothetical protein
VDSVTGGRDVGSRSVAVLVAVALCTVAMPGLGMAVGGAGGLAGGSAGVGGSLFDGPPWLAWRTEQVDAGSSRGPVDVAFLSDGTPVVHYTAGFEGVRVAERSVTGWDVTVLEE